MRLHQTGNESDLIGAHDYLRTYGNCPCCCMGNIHVDVNE